VRRALVLLLCIFGLVFNADMADAQRKKKTSTKRTRKNPTQLRSDLSAIRNRKNQLRRELAKTRKQSQVVKSDIYVLDARLERLEDQLGETKRDLSISRREQGRLEDQLESATARVAQVREQVRKRLRYMYVHQGGSVLSAFVGVKSVGDIASRKVLMSAIAKKDRQLFNDFRELQALIRDRKKRQDRLVGQIASLRNRQIDQQAHLEITKDEKRDTLQELRSKQDQIKGLIAQMEADEASIYSQIRAYEAARRRRQKPGQKPLPAFSGRFARPTAGAVSSGFGNRFHPILKYTRLHAGLDFRGSTGAPIYAAANGEVIAAQYSRSYGNMIIIDHGGGVTTVYAHASRIYVRSGQTVKRGQVIAAIGSTGLATGPHLHWEVRVNGRPVNPSSRM
jgi:murein DD-endopeptidase MepM/ murein hydrolase activator NlpD